MAQTRSIGANLLATPTVLRGSAVVATGAGITPPATFDTTKLQNTLRVPIEITELIITVLERSSTEAVVKTNENAGAAIEVDLRIGGKHLTNGFVPFQVLAPWNAGEDGAWAFAGVLTSTATFNQRRIVLPEPLRLRPGVGFSGAARRAPLSIVTSPSNVESTVTVTAIGRVVPDGILGPTAQALPLWTAATLLATSTNVVPKTDERDLFNPLQAPLDVARIIVASSEVSPLAQYATGLTGAGGRADYDPLLKLRWPNGDLLGADPLRLQSVFIREHTIAHKFQLPGGSRVTAAFDFTNAIGAYGSYLQIAIFGTRREVL